ncbi:alanine/glycine:cation symporter family protein [Anaerosporobacter sp.]|uniref:alanine/glycine:cation symporter family protein n=1 Tax=Anaerosporobacter sp. TaxID=1872529 RepID=UPI00286F96A1|nr:amino acid carrier protein [Anaerosporobacter sp.]
MYAFYQLVKHVNQAVWGLPMILLLLGTHIFYTFKLRFIQRFTFRGIRLSLQKDNSIEGDVSSFASLATILAATLGTGNIIGISTAVALGGPGAIFWCWITGILGMATSYAECYLGIKFRKKTPNGNYVGGPMYVLEHGLHSKKLAIVFSLCTLAASFGVGCTTQANSITTTTSATWHLSPSTVGFITAFLCGLVIVSGVKSIATVCTRLVPTMGAFYILSCFVILILNRNFLSQAIQLIVSSAFSTRAATGGFIGSTVLIAARQGVAKGLFTNEAGLGSAAIAAASAKTKDPSRQALVSMTATFWDTVVMCAITGLVIVSNLLHYPDSAASLTNAELTTAAFSVIPFGKVLLSFALIAFAMATLIGWSFFGESAAYYLFGNKGIQIYKVCYIIMIYIGAVLSLDLVWELSDLVNAIMAFPNLITLLLLYKLVPTYKPKL